jgi:hypothetical protein
LNDLFQRLSSPDMTNLEVHFDDGSSLKIRNDIRDSRSITYYGKDFWADILFFKYGRIDAEVRFDDMVIFSSIKEELYDMIRERAPTFFNWIIWNLV